MSTAAPGTPPHPMSRALHAEWTKVRTTAGLTWWMTAVVVLTIAAAAAASGAAHCQSASCGLDPAKISFTGIYLGQAVVAVGAVRAVGDEYSTGMITLSLTAMPRRLTWLFAKAAVLAGSALAASTLAVAGSALAGLLILPGHGFTPANGYASLTAGADIRATAGTALYLTLVALLSFGVTAAVRDSATATGLILGVLYLFPIVAAVISDPTISRRLQQIGPLPAGLDIQATTQLNSLPLSPWQGLGVVTLWAVGALLVGATLVRRRDA
jgi:ABC-2 type transport system permease protein